MNKGAIIIIGGLLTLGLCSSDLAYGQGKAALYLRQSVAPGQKDTTAMEFTARVGETVTLDLYIDPAGEAITGVQILISYDDTVFEPVLQATQGGPLAPFKEGTVLQGSSIVNKFAGDDDVGKPNGNGVAGYQLTYTENTQATPQGQRFVSAKFVVATMKVKVLRKPASGQGTIQVDANRGDGETAYFISGQAGRRINFNLVRDARINILGFSIQPIPEVLLPPGGSKTINLSQYVVDNVNWTLPDPTPQDSITAQIDQQTQTLTVRADVAGFVGVRNLTVTGTTVAGGETAQTTVRVVVNSPPTISKGVFPDTIKFDEDTVNTTLVLTGRATDADPSAKLAWTAASLGTKITAQVDTTTNRVTLRPAQDFNGSEKVQFTVADQYGAKDSTTVVVTVKPVNDPPEFYNRFPLLSVPLGGKDENIVLNAYLKDVDHNLSDSNYLFFTQNADNLVVNILPGGRVSVTPAPGALGDRKVDIVAVDPEGARARQTLTVRVTASTGPNQPPVVRRPVPDKTGMVRGGAQAVMGLDSLVTDPDTPDDRIVWTVSPGPSARQIQVNIDAQRRAIFQAPADFVGFELMTFTATDPTNLTGSFQIIVFSVEPDKPDIGGLPDPRVVAGGKTPYVNFNDYIFDATDPDADLTIKVIPPAGSGLKVDIDPATRNSVVEAPSAEPAGTKQVVFEVSNKRGNTGLDTIQVQVDPAGQVRLADFPQVSFRADQPGSLRLDDYVLSGGASRLSWTSQFNATRLSVTIDTGRVATLRAVGGFTGDENVLFTARDPVSSSQDQKTVQVTVLPASAGIKLKPLPEVTFSAGSVDRSLRLNSYVETGDTTRISWQARVASGSTTVTASIDPATRVVSLSNAPGFTGTETVVFTASDGSSRAEASAQVTVTPATAVGDFKLLVIANPIQRAFVDVFVAAKKELASEPTVIVDLNLTKPQVESTRSLVSLKKLSLDGAGNLWNGNLTLQIGQEGNGNIRASAVTTQQVPLSDVARFTVGTVNPGFALTVNGPGASLTAPPGAFREAAAVALFQSRDGEVGGGAAAKPAGGEPVPVSEAYSVVMTATPAQPVELRFDVGGVDADLAERAGVYRKEGDEWVYVGRRGTEDGVQRAVSAPILQGGVYRAMVARDLTDGTGPGRRVGGEIPEACELEQNYPNPFNPATAIRFSIPEAGVVRLQVYDVAGRVVRTLMDGAMGAGRVLVTWDGTDETGRRVASGVYFYRLEASGATLTRKMMLLK